MASYTQIRTDREHSLAHSGRGAWQQNSRRNTTPNSNPPDFFVKLLEPADIRLNGDRPWDIRVYNPKLYKRVLRHGSIGFGEAYMEGWWDCDRLDEMFTRLLGAGISQNVSGVMRMKMALGALNYRLFNFQSIKRAFHVGEHHYDIGNDLYRRMLDPLMNYSCGYWAEADTLEDAQIAKLDLACRKLKLEPGMKLLDIGCGWGAMALHAARHYGVEVTGVTVSREQKKWADELTKDLPVDIELMDYRSLTGHFDRIVSIGMFEHVGVKNYRTYFRKAAELLADDGLFLLHTIGDERRSHAPEPFIHKYIFPNGKIPSRKEINDSSFDLLRLEDWHNFGPDYDRTLMAWAANAQAAWPELSDHYDTRFRRMWMYYLYSCAGFFRSRKGQLWQLVFSKRDNRNEYRSLR